MKLRIENESLEEIKNRVRILIQYAFDSPIELSCIRINYHTMTIDLHETGDRLIESSRVLWASIQTEGSDLETETLLASNYFYYFR